MMKCEMEIRLGRILCSTIIILTLLLVATISGFYGEVYGASKAKAPKLTKLQYYQTDSNKCNVILKWKSKKRYTYQILRKKYGKKYKVIGTVKAKGKNASFVDYNVGINSKYVYSVRQKKDSKGRKKYSKYDKTGLILLSRPAFSVDFQNLKAEIKWKKVRYASQYAIYRKVGNGSYTRIATVGKNRFDYTDHYWKSTNALGSILTSSVFVDPSNNPISYTVRPYYSKWVKGTKKTSWGLYFPDGVIHLEPPTITSLDDNGTLTWGTVPQADKYIILRRSHDSSTFTEIKRVVAQTGVYQSASVDGNIDRDYYAIQALARVNGQYQYSYYDTEFTRANKRYEDKKVLFLGDSITFGSPYYGTQRKLFSYPNRVQQMTGVQYFNPSIPGSTWHFDESSKRQRIVTGVAGMIHLGNNTDWAYINDDLGIKPNKSKFKDYDVVVLAAGTNDYNDKEYKAGKDFFGSRETDWTKIDESDKTKGLTFSIIESPGRWIKYDKMDYDYDIRTFNGSYNQIMKYIEEGSLQRVMEGNEPIRVIAMDLFYSDRVGGYKYRHNRDVTKNTFGYTLLDYQRELTHLNQAWAESPVMNIYRYDTRAEGIVDHTNCPYRASDNLHFTKYAYGLYGNSISSFLIDVLNQQTKEFTEDEINKLKDKYYNTNDTNDTNE